MLSGCHASRYAQRLAFGALPNVPLLSYLVARSDLEEAAGFKPAVMLLFRSLISISSLAFMPVSPGYFRHFDVTTTSISVFNVL